MLDYAQLAAMHAVIRTGSFERAARQLGVTPSAVSQRVKALEDRIGTILIVRGTPCTATDTGRRLARHVDEVALMEHTLRDEIGGPAPEAAPVLRIAVNADSLATWFMPALAGHGALLFDLVLDDESQTADWLRRGEVSAAVSTTPGPIQGCGSVALGHLDYVATASPQFCERWLADGLTAEAFTRAPSLRFGPHDDLQDQWLHRQFGRGIAHSSHAIPSSQGFMDATLAGLGWAMNPYSLSAPLIAAGRLVRLADGSVIPVALNWHWNRAVSSAMAPVTAAVRREAGLGLRPGADMAES